MKFRFVWIGRTKDKSWKALQDDYLQRLSHFVRCEIVEIRDSDTHGTKEAEGKRILQMLDPKDFVCLLEIGGKSLSSVQLAREVEKWQVRGLKSVTFIIGGAKGTSAEVGEIANFRLSLSFMTFTHELARVILLEQLYRSFTIIHGYPYQK